MAFFNWNDDLSVKIHSIDSQHMKLIEMINDFYDNIKNRSNDESIKKLITEMRKYALSHFNLEEKYMKQFSYPDYDAHKKEHDLFMSKVVELEEKFQHGKLLLTFEITSFLKGWVKQHIQVVDKKYSQFFIDKGIV